MISPENESRAEELFQELSGLSIDERAPFIDAHCDSEEIRDLVLEKLASRDTDLGEFFSTRADRSHRGPGESDRVGSYRLLEKIGEGGFGEVYLAEQEGPVRRTVALKVLKPGMDSREVIARFDAERQALAMMNHPNIATILESGTTDSGHPYFVMELVKGTPITEFCDRNNVTPAGRLELMVTVCRAVQHAHQKGVIHRDLKPSNILVTLPEDTPVPKIIDFGVAKALSQPLTELTLFTRSGQIVGTPEYMSPEQAERSGLDVDTRSDVYSLGVLLYEILTGSTPHQAERLRSKGIAEMQRIICEEDPPTPSTRVKTLGDGLLTAVAQRRQVAAANLRSLLTGELDWIIMRALARDRARRYDSPNALALDIERYLRGDPVEAGPATVRYRLGTLARKYRATLLVSATILAILVTTTPVSIWLAIRAGSERDRAVELKEDLDEAVGNLEAERALASSQAEMWRQRFYNANLLKARHFISSGNGGRASEALDDCPDKLRGWEWYRLKYLADQSRRPLVTGLDQLSVARLSPDGSRVLSFRRDGTVQLWDLASGSELWTARQPQSTGLVREMSAFSADGARVLTSTSWSFVVRDAATGKALRTVEGKGALAFHLAADHTLALVKIWEGQPTVLDLNAGSATVLEGSVRRSRHTGFVASAAFNSDGTRVATGRSSGQINIWDATLGTKHCSLQAHDGRVTALAFTPDGTLVSTGSDHAVRRWEVDTCAPLGEETTGDWIHAVAVSPDGEHIISGGADCAITVWDGKSGEKLRSMTGHRSAVTSLQYSADGQTILSASDDGTILSWNAAPRPVARILSSHGGVAHGLAFSPDGTRVASCGEDGSVKVSERETERRVLELAVGRAAWALSYSPDGTQIASGAESGKAAGRLLVWDARSGELLRELGGEERGFWAIQYSPDGNWLAASGESVEEEYVHVYLWDTASGLERRRFRVENASNGVHDLAFSSDSRRLAACTHSGRVHIWKLENGEPSLTLEGPAPNYRRIAFQPNGKNLAGAGEGSNDVHVWNTESGELVQTLRRHTSPVSDLAYSPDGRRLFTVGGDRSLRVWDAQDGKELLIVEIEQLPYALAVSRDGSTVATSGVDGLIKIWQTRGMPPPGPE